MNRRQQKRRASRRTLHNAEARADLPELILGHDKYPEVKQAHIVPRCFQEAWAIEGQVAVHVLDEDGRHEGAVRMPTNRAGTRRRYYQRTRPDGTSSDDTEASLAYMENKAAKALESACTTTVPLSVDDKGGLAQFLGVQLLRGPRFFGQRTDLLNPLIADAPQKHFTRAAMREMGGDLSKARTKVQQIYASKTQAHLTMLASGPKLGMLLGNMRWEILCFDEPVVAYSDHPVVIWPGTDSLAIPQYRQSLGPLTALEVFVPLSPERVLVMNWIDQPDPAPAPCSVELAAQCNAFVIAQADRQWMHQIGAEIPTSRGPFRTLTGQRTYGYDTQVMWPSRRREFAAGELERNGNRVHLRDIRILAPDHLHAVSA